MWLVGIDEAGRGPVIGPLAITIFACKENKVEELIKQGVKDSKLLSSKKRIELAKMLGENESFYSETAVISAHEIDNYVDSTSLNDLEITYFAKLIDNLPKHIANNCQIMLDACEVNTDNFSQKVLSKLRKFAYEQNISSENKADLNHIHVACASILAKENREKEVSKIKEELGLEIGSGYPSDPKTKSAVQVLTKGNLPNKYLRFSWATTKNAWELNHKSQLKKRELKYGSQRKLF
ncbi:MAG: ribonuclease HII [Candidatus Poseidoniaceae archaeon]